MVIATILMFSCNSPSNTSTSKQGKEIKLETFIKSFLDSNQNWNQNEVIQAKTNEKFKAQFETALNQGLLDDFPVELNRVNEYAAGQYVAIFGSWYDKNINYANSVLNSAHFDIVGLVDEKTIGILKDGQAYYVRGEFIKFLDLTDLNYYAKYTLTYTTRIGFSDLTGFETNMGLILMNIKRITETQKL